jgi:hypothetical protein
MKEMDFNTLAHHPHQLNQRQHTAEAQPAVGMKASDQRERGAREYQMNHQLFLRGTTGGTCQASPDMGVM